MIVAIYTPSGIVISTIGYDSFVTYSKVEDEEILEKIEMRGHQHIVDFWNRYALVFHSLNPYNFEEDLVGKLEEVKKRWPQEVPKIQDLMPYIKKQIMECNLNVLGFMAGYSDSRDANSEQFVYEILGEEIRRINIDPHGKVLYNCLILEKRPIISRLFRNIKIRNGDAWEEEFSLRMNCELFSISKAKEVANFLIETASGLDHLNSISLSGYPVETVEITERGISISIK